MFLHIHHQMWWCDFDNTKRLTAQKPLATQSPAKKLLMKHSQIWCCAVYSAGIVLGLILLEGWQYSGVIWGFFRGG